MRRKKNDSKRDALESRLYSLESGSTKKKPIRWCLDGKHLHSTTHKGIKSEKKWVRASIK